MELILSDKEIEELLEMGKDVPKVGQQIEMVVVVEVVEASYFESKETKRSNCRLQVVKLAKKSEVIAGDAVTAAPPVAKRKRSS